MATASRQGLLQDMSFQCMYNGNQLTELTKVLGRIDGNKRWSLNELAFQTMCAHHSEGVPVFIASFVDDENSTMEKRRVNPSFAGPLQRVGTRSQWYRFYGFTQK